MKLGAVIGGLGPGAEAGALAAQARRLQDEGFDGLWVVQTAGRGMMMPDPLLALAAAAAVTERVTLGTAILQLPLYEPAALAHQIFSLMQLTGDRLQLGLGAGSTEADFRVFGRDFATRFARFEENLAALRGLLEKGADDRVDLTPGPAVLGGPPLLYGTWGKGVARAARKFSGWIASAMNRTDEQVVEALQTYRSNGGKNAIVSSIVLGAEQEAGSHRKRLDLFAEAGFDEAVVIPLPGGPATAEVRSWVES